MGLRTMLQKHPKTGIYYFRKRVPSELVEIFKRKEFKQSLGTKDPKEAKKLVKEVERSIDSKIEAARASTASLEEKTITKPSAKQYAQEWLENRLHTYTEDYTQRRLEKDYPFKEDEIHQDPRSNLEIDLDDELELAREALNERNYKAIDSLIKEIATNKGVAIEEDSSSYNNLGFELLKANIRYCEEAGKFLQATWDGKDYTFTSSTTANHKPVDNSKTTPYLSELFATWKKENNPRTRTVMDWEESIRRFTELNGKLQVHQITKAHIRDYRDAIAQMPYKLSKEQRATPLPQLIKQPHNEQLISKVTVNKKLAVVHSILELALKHGYIDINHAKGLRLKAEKKDRLPYTLEDLKRIFHSPIYKGRLSASRRTEKGDRVIKDSLYWLPLIALYTGARAEEIGQLHLDDMKQEDGIHYFDINDYEEDKKLKNRSSKRKVPIHPTLIKAGLLDYSSNLKGNRLFPDLEMNKEGRYTKAFSQAYGRVLKKLGIVAKGNTRKDFHSFRHTFKDACRDAGIITEIHDRLTGHTPSGVGASYGIGQNLKTLNQAIQKINYAGLDLSHLFKKGKNNGKK